MRRQQRSSLVQIADCRLFGAKPLSEPMLVFWQLESWDETIEIQHFHSKKIHLKTSSVKRRPFCPGGDQLSMLSLVINDAVSCYGLDDVIETVPWNVEALNPWTTGNTRVHTQHCSYWCPGAKAPGYQYPRCWLNIHCIWLVSYRNITILGNNIRK